MKFEGKNKQMTSKKDLGKEIGRFALSMICGVCAIFLGLAIWIQDLYEPYYVIRLLEFIVFSTSGIIMMLIGFINLVKTANGYWRITNENSKN